MVVVPVVDSVPILLQVVLLFFLMWFKLFCRDGIMVYRPLKASGVLSYSEL